MNKKAIKAGLAALALAGTVGLAGCGNNDTGNTPIASTTPAASQSSSASSSSSMSPGSSMSPSSSSSSSTQFNAADVMFVQGMLPHHKQAVAMSETLLKKFGVNPKVTALAKEIKAAQQPEITTMEGWLKAWGQKPTGSGMGGMNHGDMGDGMATDAELKQFEKADGATTQKTFLEMMTKHHQGAVKMAQMQEKNGKNTDAIQLAKDIVISQQKEITTMQKLLPTL